MNEFEAAFFYGDFSSLLQKFKLEFPEEVGYNQRIDNNFLEYTNACKPLMEP
jgi:hypothetical protein